MNDRSRAPADPSTRARIDALIDHLRVHGVRMLPSTIVEALIDAGLSADAAEVLGEAVLARMGERVAPADDPALRPRRYAGI
jgi:hypothetical protein